MSSFFPVAAFWRGINIGPHKRIPMAELRRILQEMGFVGVRTLLNSGNAVFGVEGVEPAATGELATPIRDSIRDQLGVDAAVQVVTGERVQATVRDIPFSPEGLNGSRLLVGFLDDAASAAAADPESPLVALARENWGEERMGLAPGAVYIWSPNGVLDSQSHAAVQKEVKEGVTFRNWNTLLKVEKALGEVG